MLNGTPPGTSGAAHQSGWMNREIFLQWLLHFAKHTKCSPEKPVLLLMDNHCSHVAIGTILLTFPPHCSHKVQPLDRTVYFPLKAFYSDCCSRWMLNHPVSGVWPFNPDVFGDDEFLPSSVTDRPIEAAEPEEVEAANTLSTTPVIQPKPSTSSDSTSYVVTTKKATPIEFRPFARAGPHKKTQNLRKVKSMVLTDTPVKL